MFYRYNFVEGRALLKVKVYGTANLQNMRSRLTLLVNDHRWKREYKLLIDYSGVTVIDTPKPYSESLKELLDEIPEERLPVGIAYVFPERLFCQCFEPAHLPHSIEAGCKVRFFSREEEAIAWLEKLAAEYRSDRETP
jgi:hypothetical protein